MINLRSTRRRATICLERDGVCLRNVVERNRDDDGEWDENNDCGLWRCRTEWEFHFRGISCSYRNKMGNLISVKFYESSMGYKTRIREELITIPKNWTPRIFLILAIEEGMKLSLVFSFIVNNTIGQVDICNVIKKYSKYDDKELNKLVYHSEYYVAINGNL
mmetsp:Transcript_17974/g.25402  ORF Transcript_17974/g.25402 Transcript_17974/m.25402 type:complete len:162 (-) Transcript_17974:25-510(-)